jgi:hypothetical protein
MPKIVG